MEVFPPTVTKKKFNLLLLIPMKISELVLIQARDSSSYNILYNNYIVLVNCLEQLIHDSITIDSSYVVIFSKLVKSTDPHDTAARLVAEEMAGRKGKVKVTTSPRQVWRLWSFGSLLKIHKKTGDFRGFRGEIQVIIG